MKASQFILLTFAGILTASAEVRTETRQYKEGNTTLEGHFAYDTRFEGKRPGVLIAHQWKGLSAYEKKRAEMLAELGYVVFAVDIYGKGIRPGTTEEASKLSGEYKANRALLRKRVRAGLEVLKSHPLADPSRIAAIGYCFGGTTVLELARDGADIAGVVSFHGALATPRPQDAANIRCKVLALHGADDPFVPPAEVDGFEQEMRNAKVDWQLISYGGAVHSFTDFNAGDDPSKGSAYNKTVDRRSWEAMKLFFKEIFQQD